MPAKHALIGPNAFKRAKLAKLVYPHCTQSSFATIFYFAHPDMEGDELSHIERHAELMLDAVGMPCWIVMDNMDRAHKEYDSEADAEARADLRTQTVQEWFMDNGKRICLEDVNFHSQIADPKRQSSVGYGVIVDYY